MVILFAFAFVAGAATALSPCMLPVLTVARVDGRRRRAVRVDSHRLYEVARTPRAGAHLLTLSLPKGTEAHAFTFG